MTSWPNIPKGMRKGMRLQPKRSGPPYTGQSIAGRGPYPCKRCGLVYTPGHYQEHAQAYHNDAERGR